MRERYSALIYLLIATFPIGIMTGLSIIMIKQDLGSQFANWWTLTIPKLILITIVTAIAGVFIGIPLAKTFTQVILPFTIKRSMEVFSMTALIVILDLCFSLFVGSADTYETGFFINYASTSLLLTVALCTAIYCFKR